MTTLPEYFIYLPILSIALLAILITYVRYKKSREDKNFTESVTTHANWIEEMVAKYQLAGSVRKKSYEKLVKDENLASRLELLGPMLFYTQYQRRTPNATLQALQNWVKWTHMHGFKITLFVFPLAIFAIFVWAILAQSYILFLIPISAIIMGLYTLVAIITKIIHWVLEHLKTSYTLNKQRHAAVALQLMDQCKNIAKLAQTLEKIDIQNAASETNYILQQIREIFKQIGETWISYIKSSKALLGSPIFYSQEQDILEEEYHKEVFRWIADKTSEIEWIIELKLWIIAKSIYAQRSNLIELQTTTSEFSANGALELQAKRLEDLEKRLLIQ
jgi:hypothetical protein